MISTTTSGTVNETTTDVWRQEVTGIVYEALLTICGRELDAAAISSPQKDDDDDKNDNSVWRWRQELKLMVNSSITIRDPEDVLKAPNFSRTKLYDIEIRTAAALFQRYRRRRHDTNKDDEEDYSLTVVSDMGVIRCLDSAYTLASQLLLPVVESALASVASCSLSSSSPISHHVRVAPQSGFVCIVTVALMTRLQQQLLLLLPNSVVEAPPLQLLPCPKCPVWCQGNKGLWWHLQQQHDQPHHTATETATYQVRRNSTALIVYDSNQHPTTSSSTTTAASTHDLVGTRVGAQSLISEPSVSSSNIIENASPKVVLVRRVALDEDDPWSCVKRGSLSDLQHWLDTYQTKDTTTTATHFPSVFDCRTTTDRYGALLLHWAAGGGHVDMVQYLVEVQNCDPCAPQHGQRAFAGRTALHWAARYGHLTTVHYLMNHSVFVNQTNQKKSGCAQRQQRVRRDEHEDAVTRLLEATTVDGTTAFCWAAWQGHLEVMKVLHAHGCRVDTRNQFGCNAVLWAAQGLGDISTVEWLETVVGCGGLIVMNHSGHGLMHKAAQWGRRDLCQWFLQERLFRWLQQQPHDTLNGNGALSNYFDSMVNVLDLVGPANDGCTPSDLAGMEDHDELALYLAEQEMALVKAAMVVSSSSTDAVSHLPTPDWLVPPGIHTTGSNQLLPHVWEPWAGVFRMRSVVHSDLGA